MSVTPAGIRLATVAIAGLAWEALAWSGVLYEGVVPPLEAVAAAFVALVFSAELYHHLAVTGWEVLAGFLIGTLSGTLCGIVMGARPLLGRAMAPAVDALATAPKIVFLPIAMLALGVGIASKIALGALSGFFPVVLNTAAGMAEIDPVLIRVGHSFHLGRTAMLRKIYLPALARPIVTGMRLGLGVTIIGVLLAEIKLANAGLGFLAMDDYNNYRIPEMYALLVLIFVIAALANALIGRLTAGPPLR
jgi:ABC-type nitrate/sulfonate/bicarbonate transport system permease component